MSSLLGQVPTARSESVQPFLLSLAGKIADDGFGLSMVGDAQEHPNVYLPLSFKIIVWNLYYVAVSNALCYTQFLRVWARECPWIKLARKIGTHKVCRICGMLRLELLKRNTQARKLELRDIGSKHLEVIKRARGAHADRDLLALPVQGKPSSEALSASVDKAGKQCSTVPWLKETMKGLWDNRKRARRHSDTHARARVHVVSLTKLRTTPPHDATLTCTRARACRLHRPRVRAYVCVLRARRHLLLLRAALRWRRREHVHRVHRRGPFPASAQRVQRPQLAKRVLLAARQHNFGTETFPHARAHAHARARHARPLV